MRIGFLSDLHITNNSVGLSDAVEIVLSACQKAGVDKLFIAGDTFNNYKRTFEFVELLNQTGLETYTILGNHEYWSTSHEKIKKINNDYYIHGKAIDIDNDWIVIGLDGMFDHSFVTDVDNYHNNAIWLSEESINKSGEIYFDLDKNKVGGNKKEYKKVFAEMDATLVNLLETHKEKNIILMTHYVPSSEFVHYSDTDDNWNKNNAFMGSIRYQELAEKYGVKKVIFGHTHTRHNKTINGVDYHCNPVGYMGWEFLVSFEAQVNKRLKVFEI